MEIEIEYFKSIGHVVSEHNDLILLHLPDKYTTTIYYKGRYGLYKTDTITDDFNSHNLHGILFSFMDYMKNNMVFGASVQGFEEFKLQWKMDNRSKIINKILKH